MPGSIAAETIQVHLKVEAVQHRHNLKKYVKEYRKTTS